MDKDTAVALLDAAADERTGEAYIEGVGTRWVYRELECIDGVLCLLNVTRYALICGTHKVVEKVRDILV